MGVASGCGEQEVGVASGSGWNLCVWLLGVVVKPGSQYVAQLRGAARRGAALATICEHSTAHESRRAARIDPSSKLAARCGAADAARPIK